MSEEKRQALAREVADFHRRGKLSQRPHALRAEKFLVVTDGADDGQWADIIGGELVGVLPNPGRQLRRQLNLVKPITANMIKHHASIPFRCTVEAGGDRRARDRAKVDAALGNHHIRTQRLNQVFAQALWMSAPFGHCPVHVQWRQDVDTDSFSPVYDHSDGAAGLERASRAFADWWVGDPWDTVYNSGATRTSVHRMAYGRSVPAALIRHRFKHLRGIADLKGHTNLPSASRFQQTARKLLSSSGLDGIFGGSAVDGGGQESEEIIALVCDELLPGMDPKWPMGRLAIVALGGRASTEEGVEGAAEPVLLHAGPLPGRRFSAVRVYATDSFDDVLGRPWSSDLVDLQQQLNQSLTMRTERIRRYSRTQLVAMAGGLEDDTAITVDDAILYYTGEKPGFLQPPQADPGLFSGDIGDTMEAMFRIGGWQAASRGEGSAGDSGAKVVALARADDSIFATTNIEFQATVCESLQLGHVLVKSYATGPMRMKAGGSDTAHLGTSEITVDDLSDEPPTYTLVQGSAGADAKLQQLLNLVQTKGADGEPLLTTAKFHEDNPDPSLRPIRSEIQDIRRRRPYAVNAALVAACDGAQEAGPLPEPYVPIIAQEINNLLLVQFRIEEGDDPQLHIDALDELILDETTDALVREVARLRRGAYQQRQMQLQRMQMQQQAQQQMAMQSANAAAGAQGAAEGGGGQQPAVQSPGAETGAGLYGEMAQAQQGVPELTAEAMAMGA